MFTSLWAARRDPSTSCAGSRSRSRRARRSRCRAVGLGQSRRLLMVLGGIERPNAGRVLVDGQDLGAARRGRAGAAAARPYRHRVSVVSFDPDDDRARKRGVAAGVGRPPRRIRRRRAGLSTRSVSATGSALSGAAVGRRTAACRDRPRLYRRPEPAARRRADRQSRRRDRRVSSSTACSSNAPGTARPCCLITHDESLAGRCARRIRLADGIVAEDRDRGAAAAWRSAPGRGEHRLARLYPIRLAGRELRGGIARAARSIACLVLGVGAIAGIGSLAASLSAGIAGDARELLGGDVEAQLAYRPAERRRTGLSGEERHAVRGRLDAGDGAHDPTGIEQSLIELKAVDDAYPLYRQGRALAAAEPHALRWHSPRAAFSAPSSIRRSSAGSTSKSATRSRSARRRCRSAARSSASPMPRRAG